MIDRYVDHVIRDIWSDQARYGRWGAIERMWIRAVHACTGAKTKLPRMLAASWSPTMAKEVEEFEQVTNHDMRAFLLWMESKLPEDARWLLHLGLTNSDVVDTSNAMAIYRSSSRVQYLLKQLNIELKKLRATTGERRLPAHTHGQIAGYPSANRVVYALIIEAVRASDQLMVAKVPYGLGGPVGDWTILGPIADNVLFNAKSAFSHDMHGAYPGMSREVKRSQIVSRQHYVKLAHALVNMSLAVSKIAMDLRFLHLRGFINLGSTSSSSSMPHKNNPVSLEKVCGLSRVVRGYGVMAENNTELWEMRDISNSSVERIWLPDIYHTVAHQISTLTRVIRGLSFDWKEVILSHSGFFDSHAAMVQDQLNGTPYSVAWENARQQNKGG